MIPLSPSRTLDAHPQTHTASAGLQGTRAFGTWFTAFVPAFFVIMVWLALASTAVAKRYTFERVSPLTGDGHIRDSQVPEINDLGSVLYVGEMTSGSTALLLARNGGLTVVAEHRGAPYTGIRFNSTGDQQLNNLDEVTFFGEPLEDDYVYVWSAGQLTPVYRIGGQISRIGNGGPAINDHGQITFSAESAFGTPEAILLGHRDGRTPTILAATGGSLPDGFSSFFDPTIDNTGRVYVDAVRNGLRGIHDVTNPGHAVTISDADDPIRALGGTIGITDVGLLGFQGLSAATGGRGIYIADAHGITPHVEYPADAPMGLNFDINDRGEIVHMVFLPNRIFAGADPVSDRVIGPGDALSGVIVESLYFGTGGLNKHGQVAFSASTRHPTTGERTHAIYVATPVDSPVAAAERIAFSHFDEPALGATRFDRTSPTQSELEFIANAGPGVSMLGTNRAFHISNATLRLTTEFVDVSQFEAVSVSIDLRAWETSTASDFESDDYLRAYVETRIGTTVEQIPLGPELRGGTVDALKWYDISGESGPFGRFSITVGDIVESLRIVIEARNNSASEHFAFDNLTIEGVAVIPEPSTNMLALVATAIVLAAQRITFTRVSH